MAPNSDKRVDLLLALSASLEPEHPVTIGTMFRSPAIRSGNKVVAFLGHGDTLIVKVIDKESGELIRQMPTEEAVRIAKVLQGKLPGLLVSHQA